RSTDKSYPGDNRLISPKSSHRRGGLAPRCRLIASWGCSRSQGLGCSPIKAVRELGSERRETAAMMTSSALVFYSFGLVGNGVKSMLTRVFYSLKDTKTPMINSAYALGLNFIFNLILIQFMGHNGLA